MASLAKRVARIPFAPVVALLFAVAAAVLAAVTPQWHLERWAELSGLLDVLPLAKPPLGMKARALFVIATFLIVGGGLWFVIGAIERYLTRPRHILINDQNAQPEEPAVPETSRKPILAGDELGAPLMSDAALTTVPPVVEEPQIIEAPEAEPEPIVAEDAAESIDEAPAAVEEIPAAAEEVPVTAAPFTDDPELSAPLSVDEFDLPPLEDDPVAEGDTSIDALIRRLEAGIARRRALPPTPGPGGAAPEPAPRGSAPLNLSSDWMMPQTDPSNDDDATRSAMETLQRMAKR